MKKIDISTLRNILEFVNQFDVTNYEALEIIGNLEQSIPKEINDEYQHLITNSFTTQYDLFKIKIIEQYYGDMITK